jgi:thiosulfate/3-mercaptopyruvate sulfurtransferase
VNNTVTTQWLETRLDAPDIVVLDASWHLPSTHRIARDEYTSAHIPGARFFDLDFISEPESHLPHMLPSASRFAAEVKKLGIGDGKQVIVYDTIGLFSAARCWWMFKVFGHDDVCVLDGGLPKWKSEGRSLTDQLPPAAQPRHFTPRPRGTMVRTLQDVVGALASGSSQLADARSGTRFRGEEPEPRPGVRPGHMPGARNVHYASLLNPDGTLKAHADLKAVFEAAGVDLRKPLITTCGSGVTAAIINLALAELGVVNHTLYDGSWAEWGASDQPLATGPA